MKGSAPCLEIKISEDCKEIKGPDLKDPDMERSRSGEMMRRCLCALALLAAVSLCACSAQKSSPESYTANYLDYFDTVASVTIYTDSEEKFEELKTAMEEEFEYYDHLFDIYNSYPDLVNVKTINDNAGIAPVKVSQPLFDLLKFSLDMYEETNGRVNIAMGSVLSIWHDYRERGEEFPGGAAIPDIIDLEKAAVYTDIYEMQLDDETLQVYLPDPHMSLDVGAIGKCFSTQRTADTLKELGVTSGLLSVGGDVIAIGERGDGKPWRIGIQNPDLSAENAYLHVVGIADKSVVTSGTYQRYFEVDGVRYHHIIQPDLLFPWNIYQSVTVIADDGAVADAFSTAIFNMEPDEGVDFVEAHEGVEAMWIMEDGSEVFSSGFADYMSE